MKILNIYLFLALPSLLWSVWLCATYPDVLVGLSVDALHTLGYGKQGISGRMSILIEESFSSFSIGNNYFFFSLLAVLITCCFYFFVNHQKYAFSVFFLGILFFPVLNLFIDAIWLRRIIFFILILPTIPKIWSFLSSGFSSLGGGYYYQNLLKVLSGILLLILSLPGFYVPPFFDGIAGWYIENDSPKSYTLTSLRVRFSDNSTAWFRPSLFNPMTMHDRPLSIIRKRDPDFYNSGRFFYFLKSLYAKAYPSLADKKLPTEKVLGRLAYKPHTLDRFDTRELFLPPTQIIAFELVQIRRVEGVRSETIQQSWFPE